MADWKSWFLAFRPKTLTAALVPIIVGTALVHFLSLEIRWWIPGLALLAALFIQIGTNLVNDAVDFQKGADTEERIGPMRVTQKGIFTSQKVMIAATLCFLIAVLCGIPLVLEGGTPILLIGLLSVLLGYGYTAGPFPLAYLGLGDPFVILFFGLIAVGGLVYLMTGKWIFESLVLGLQIGFLATVLIAINNLRDLQGDQKVGKKTWPVRFGKNFARAEIAFLCFAPFVLNIYWFVRAGWIAGLLPFLAFPLAVRVALAVYRTEPSPVYNQFLAKGAALHLLFGVFLSLGFIIC